MLRILRVFRCIRALRALRVLRENITVRIVMSTLINAASPIGITMLLAFVLIAIISNLGQSLFSGVLWRCSEVWIPSEEACVGVGADGLDRRWSRSFMHFDWIGHALVSVFAIATNEGWALQMRVAMDQSGEDRAVVQDSRPLAGAYFAGSVLLANLICLNMFRGVFIDVFSRCATVIDRELEALHPPQKPRREDLPTLWDRSDRSELRVVVAFSEQKQIYGRTFQGCEAASRGRAQEHCALHPCYFYGILVN